MLLAMQAELEECPWLRVVRTREEAETARASGARYAFLTIEGMEPIGADLTQLDRLAGLGVRMGMLTWNGEDQLATGAGGILDRADAAGAAGGAPHGAFGDGGGCLPPERRRHPGGAGHGGGTGGGVPLQLPVPVRCAAEPDG